VDRGKAEAHMHALESAAVGEQTVDGEYHFLNVEDVYNLASLDSSEAL